MTEKTYKYKNYKIEVFVTIILIALFLFTNVYAEIGKTRHGCEAIYGISAKNYRNWSVYSTKEFIIFCHFDNLICDAIIYYPLATNTFTKSLISKALRFTRNDKWSEEKRDDGTHYRNYIMKAVMRKGKYGEYLIVSEDEKKFNKLETFPIWYFEN